MTFQVGCSRVVLKDHIPAEYIFSPDKESSLLRSTVLPFAAAAVLITPIAAAAEDGWDFYGQLNFGLFDVDDGTNSDTFITDNDNSNSRIGAIYRRGVGNGNEFRFHFETGVGLPGSSGVNVTDNGLETNGSRRDLRKLEVIYQTADYGTFSFGQGSTAADGVAEVDFSGTGVIAYSSPGDLGGGNEFQLAGAGGASGVRVGNVFNSFDGGRRLRLKYDSPTWSGFGVSVSAGEEVLARGNDNSFYDLGLRYDRDLGDIKLATRVGYSVVDGGEQTVAGSIAAIHKPTGLNASFAFGEQLEIGDASSYYIKLGIKRDWLSVGSTAISVDYADGSDFVTLGSSSSSYGISAVQKIDDKNLEVYATYRTFEYDAPGVATDNIDLAAIGVRFKF